MSWDCTAQVGCKLRHCQPQKTAYHLDSFLCEFPTLIAFQVREECSQENVYQLPIQLPNIILKAPLLPFPERLSNDLCLL